MLAIVIPYYRYTYFEEFQSLAETFLFINAWNEWAEGNHLKPCQKWGTQYLEMTKEILKH